jgi:type II secretory pathway pseudopilin PulG
MARSTSRAADGLALIELLVALVVITIVMSVAILIVAGVKTKTVDHSCSREANRLEQAVTEYKSKHGAPPSAARPKQAIPNVYADALTVEEDNDVSGNSLNFSYYGTAVGQWNYDAKTGTVVPGRSCT